MELDRDTINRLSETKAGESIKLINGKQGVLLPSDAGWTMEVIDPVERVLPDSIHQTVTFLTDDSLIAYVNDFKSGTLARMFVMRDPPSVEVILNYHATPDSADPEPNYADHKAKYPMPWSPQWKRWSGLASGPGVSQGGFLEFLEENGDDIQTPMPAKLVSIIGSLSSRKKVEFKSGLRLSDGTMELNYVEESEATGGAKNAIMPTEMTIGIPIFMDGPAYAIKVLIRYRINEGRLSFHIVLNRAEFMVEDATKEVAMKVAAATGLTALWGKVL